MILSPLKTISNVKTNKNKRKKGEANKLRRNTEKSAK